MIKQIMDPVVKKKWLKALRSGKYEQGQECLLTRTEEGDKFCCLGVLCNLYAKEHPGTGFKKLDEDWYFYETYADLPENVAGWADIDTVNRICSSSDGSLRTTPEHLAYMNDDEDMNMNFNQIADWIDKNL